MKKWVSSSVFLYFSIIILIGSFICWYNLSTVIGNGLKESEGPYCQCVRSNPKEEMSKRGNAIALEPHLSETNTCPDHFRWIHEDLRPWKASGITRKTLESAKGHSFFRLVIVQGRVYMEQYKKCFQTRDIFTVWGILQLLRLYPGKVPDLELMFNCDDKPEIEETPTKRWLAKFLHFGPPPPMFQYCGNRHSLGILFPDWTFWGWAETNIRPWASLLEDLRESNKRMKWKDRKPYAYWKGNPRVNPDRGNLIKCNVSGNFDYNARVFNQDWLKEANQGFDESKLEDQCTHRYKIYVEGRGWSVSDKYILACDSMALFVKPLHRDFFTRALEPLKHYWPVGRKNLCSNIQFAANWGNNHTDEAQAIGKAGSAFVQENLRMKYVYDYMFHSLNDYSKLLKFKPQVPGGAVEMCLEKMACENKGSLRHLLMESVVHSPSSGLPCKMHPAYSPTELEALIERNENVTREVELLEDQQHRQRSGQRLWRPLRWFIRDGPLKA